MSDKETSVGAMDVDEHDSGGAGPGKDHAAGSGDGASPGDDRYPQV